MASEWEGLQLDLASTTEYSKFSDYITSPTFRVEVGKKPKIFLIHSELLAKESDRLKINVHGGFKESKDKTIKLVDEDPNLFGYFVEYLYSTSWDLGQLLKSVEEWWMAYTVCIRLYALGDRLQAIPFRSAVLEEFLHSFSDQTELPDCVVLEMLQIVLDELPDTVNEDPLRKQILWFAARRLTRLQRYPPFAAMLDSHSELAKSLCRWAGDTDRPQPKAEFIGQTSTFEAERFY